MTRTLHKDELQVIAKTFANASDDELIASMKPIILSREHAKISHKNLYQLVAFLLAQNRCAVVEKLSQQHGFFILLLLPHSEKIPTQESQQNRLANIAKLIRLLASHSACHGIQNLINYFSSNEKAFSNELTTIRMVLSLQAIKSKTLFKLLKNNKFSASLYQVDKETPDDVILEILREEHNYIGQNSSHSTQAVDNFLALMIKANKFEIIIYLLGKHPELSSTIQRIILSNVGTFHSKYFYQTYIIKQAQFHPLFLQAYLCRLTDIISSATFDEIKFLHGSEDVQFDKFLRNNEESLLFLNFLMSCPEYNDCVAVRFNRFIIMLCGICLGLTEISKRFITEELLKLLDSDQLSIVLKFAIGNNDHRTIELILAIIKTDSLICLDLIDHCITGMFGCAVSRIVLKAKLNEIMQSSYLRSKIAKTESPMFFNVLRLEAPIALDLFPSTKRRDLYRRACLAEDNESASGVLETLNTRCTLEVEDATKTPIPSQFPEHDRLVASYGSGLTQEQFRLYRRYISVSVCMALKEKRFGLVTSLSSTDMPIISQRTIALMRQLIAIKMGSFDFPAFGHLRQHDRNAKFYTPISDRYYPYLSRLLETALEDDDFFSKDGHLVEYASDNFILDFIKLVNGQLFIDASIHDVVLNEIELTTYCECHNASAWIHTAPEYIAEILRHVDDIIEQIALAQLENTPESRDLLLNLVAQVHWWLAHSAAFGRGSASIAEAITIGLCMYHGYNLTWQRDGLPCMPDCEALTSTCVDTYIERYKSFAQLSAFQIKEPVLAPIELSSAQIFANSFDSSQEPPTTIPLSQSARTAVFSQ